MKISNAESTRAGQIAGINQTSPVSVSTEQEEAGAAASNPAATLELSQPAQTISMARQAVAAVPETRDDLVSRIKSQVDSGSYYVSSDDIADQMVRRAQADSIR